MTIFKQKPTMNTDHKINF